MSPKAPRWLHGRWLKAIVVVTVGLAVAGCLPSLRSTETIAMYRLTPATGLESGPVVDWGLFVERPSLSQALDTTRIAVRIGEHELRYLQGAVWEDRASTLMQNLMVATFENSDRIASVSTDTIGSRAGRVLRSDLREMHAVYVQEGVVPQVRVRLFARLLRRSDVEVLAKRQFQAAVMAENESVDAIIDAFDQATDEICRELVDWALSVPARPVDDGE
jgi:cholesterol transport system auxiliary component